jgi:hypothetical protein
MAISLIKYIKRSKILVFGLFFSCKAVPDIQGFDSLAWKNDINGCEGKRFLLSTSLENERKKLKGIAGADLTRLLGTPNEVQVMERQQKYYIYWIQNPKICQDSVGETKEVRIRLSAIDRVTEVIF